MREHWVIWRRAGIAAVVTGFSLFIAGRDASATQDIQQGRGEIQSRVSVQNTFQHDAARNIDWVQERNEVRFDLKYNLIKAGDEWLGLKVAKFNMLYRGRYDSVFDARKAYRDRGYDRDDFRFPEGKYPREIFLDLGFAGALKPLSMRIGRQQVVWGEADFFRSLDVVNPLRVDQNGLVGEDFADYREPLWIAKFLWDIGSIGPLAETGLEFFYSPNGKPTGDRPTIVGETYRIHTDQNNAVNGFKRNTNLPFQQVRHPWEFLRVGGRKMDAPATVQNQDGSFSDFIYQISSDVPSKELTFSRSMVGLRLLGTTVGNAYFTLNYLFKRTDLGASAGVIEDLYDAAQPGTGAVRADILAEAISAIGTPDMNGNGFPDGVEEQLRKCLAREKAELMLVSMRSDPTNPALNTPGQHIIGVPPAPPGVPTSTGCLPIPRWHPWTHIIGFTLTYNDYDYTGFVWRTEQSLSTKEPGNGISFLNPSRLKQGCGVTGEGLGCAGTPSSRDFATHGMRTTQIWRGMIGFDYLRAIAPMIGKNYPQPIRSFLSDQWVFTFQVLNEYRAHADNQTALTTSFTDRVQHWNPLFTASGSGFFLHQKLRPLLAAGFEVNQNFPVFILQADYNFTNRLALRLGEVVYAGSKNAQDNTFLNYYADRDTAYARVTYYLM